MEKNFLASFMLLSTREKYTIENYSVRRRLDFITGKIYLQNLFFNITNKKLVRKSRIQPIKRKLKIRKKF